MASDRCLYLTDGDIAAVLVDDAGGLVPSIGGDPAVFDRARAEVEAARWRAEGWVVEVVDLSRRRY